jgi:hypothetical protein
MTKELVEEVKSIRLLQSIKSPEENEQSNSAAIKVGNAKDNDLDSLIKNGEVLKSAAAAVSAANTADNNSVVIRFEQRMNLLRKTIECFYLKNTATLTRISTDAGTEEESVTPGTYI